MARPDKSTNVKANYFKHIADWVMDYYKSHTPNPPQQDQFLVNKLIEDWHNQLITEAEVKELLTQLTPSQLKDAHDTVLSTIDLFSPDELSVDLLELIDPDYKLG